MILAAQVLLLLLLPGLDSGVPTGEEPDLRVQVDLKNGSSISGVARGGVMLERKTRRGYYRTKDKSDRRSGIRIWHYRNTNGFIFITYRRIKGVRILGKLSREESLALRRAAEKVEKEPSVSVSRGKEGEAQPLDLSGLEASERDLLVEFDPRRGWGATRYGEIQRRRIILGYEPTKREERFCDVFMEWHAAFKKWSTTKRAASKGKTKQKQEERKAPLSGS